ITCMPAPGQAESADRTSAARDEVERFCGEAEVEDFSVGEDGIVFGGGADDWGYRRMVLHYAHLAAQAGGVEAFLIGSELRGLTTLRDEDDRFPFVEQLIDLTAEVRSVAGDGTKLSYAADWSEYFGLQPADGSGDVFFHLDALWADDEIDAIGIDNYMPLADWRDEDVAGGNPDGLVSPYDRDGLRAAISSGEGFDWYYASEAARLARERTPITDGAAGKPWVYRYKDIVSWWLNPHFDRIGGVESAAPTAWVPKSKPIWFTELGSAAVDKGPNQPNVFPDPKSSENALPHFSSGGRSDLAQRRFLEAHLDHWDEASARFDEAGNPVSPLYGGRMVDAGRIYCWAWDARPFPAFPLLRDVWADGDNWLRGHWLTGRVAAPSLSDLIGAILTDHGIDAFDCEGVEGVVHGYLVSDPGSARDALSPLIELFDLAATEAGGRLVFRNIGHEAGALASVADPVAAEGGRPAIERARRTDHELPSQVSISFIDRLADYQAGSVSIADTSATTLVAAHLSFPGVMDAGQAEALAADWLSRARNGRETIKFATTISDRAPLPGRLI
ncbi:MAG: glycoside hydrolase/phage tail family protein, partial [Mesorhizobium sp.]